MPSSFLVYAGANKLKANFFGQDFPSITILEFGTNFLLPVFELLLAVGLILVPRRSVIILAIVTFSSFAGYLIRTKWIGHASCPCVGNLSSNATLMLGLDMFCISLLLMHGSLQEFLPRLWVVLGFGLLIPCASCFWIANPRLADAITIAMKPSVLRVECELPEEIMATSKYLAQATISNRTSTTIEIAEFMPSCACSKIYPNSLVLAPGQTKSLSLTVDLNKAFQGLDQMHSRLEVFVACHDRQRDELANLRVLSTSVNRTFAPVKDKILHLCTDDKSDCEIPIRWIGEHLEPSIAVFVEGQSVPCTLNDTGVIVQVPHLRQPFASVVYELRHNSSRGTCSAEVQVSFVSNPDRLSMQSLTLATTSDNKKGKMTWYDRTGKQATMNEPAHGGNHGEFRANIIALDNLGNQYNAGYAQTEWTNEKGLRQSLHIPLFSKDENE